jgi:two-component system sensor histidine kinase/response regulator
VICLGNVFYNIHLMTNISVANAGTSHEIRSLRGVQYLTYIFWLLFPLVNGLHQLGYLDVVQHEICMVVVDVLAKNVYSVTLLSGNFCVLDMVATIRIAQIKSEAGSKRTSVVNAEAVKKALQMAVMEAETSARLSRRFLANISHELRTPLNSVIAFNSLLLEAEDLNSVHRDYVRSSFTSAEALLGIINQVLEYARLGAGQPERGDKHLQGLVELDSAPFSVQLLCDDLCDILGARAASRMVDFSINCPELWGPPANVTWLYGDGFRVRQVIIILCDNGLKFAKKLGGKASVDILMDPWENDPQFVRLLVKVSDNGVGISPEKQNKLFKPFSQVHDSYESGKQEGTGLGLAICQKIVRSMGGSVTVSSDGNGQGSIFSVEVLMPRVDPPAGTVQLTSQKTLDGKVHLLLPDGPTRQVLTKACVSFGLSVEGNALPDELGDDFSPATIAHALALMEQQQRAQTDGGVAQVGEVFVVGAKLFMQLHDRSPTLVASAPIVCLSFLSQLPELRQRKGISMDRVQLTPVKVAGLRAKIDMLLTQAASVSADDSTPASTRPTASALGQISIPRVLVTDDQSVNQKVAVAMLRKILGKDLEVAVANNGKEGLDAAIAGGLDGPLRYDMILMDVQMPFMDGLEATRKIREWEAKRSDGQSYFIVAMTAHASQSDIDECLNSGMNRYTSKPVNMSIFRTVLEVCPATPWSLPSHCQYSLSQPRMDKCSTLVLCLGLSPTQTCAQVDSISSGTAGIQDMEEDKKVERALWPDLCQ